MNVVFTEDIYSSVKEDGSMPSFFYINTRKKEAF